MDILSKIRTVDDFPKPGIKFLDVTSLLEDPAVFKHTVKWFEKIVANYKIESIVAIDARGFVWGGAVSAEIQCPLYLARKPGKLPGEVVTKTYDTEYSTASLSMLKNSDIKGPVLVIDDILATGGTLKATGELLTENWNISPEQQVHAVLVKLNFLDGYRTLTNIGHRVLSLSELD